MRLSMGRRHSAGAGSAGFTLIEIIVVLVIMALIAGLVLSRGPVGSRHMDLEATVRTLTGALRLARGQAIAADRVVVVRVAENGFAIDGGPTWRLASGQSISPATVMFTPEGESSGGMIVVSSGAERVAIGIDWLTGRVRSGAVER
jgi:general secretion pathway protein H